MITTLEKHRTQTREIAQFVAQHMRTYNGKAITHLDGFNLETVDDWENVTLYIVSDLLASALEQLGEPVITTRKHNLWVCETCGQALVNHTIVPVAMEILTV